MFCKIDSFIYTNYFEICASTKLIQVACTAGIASTAVVSASASDDNPDMKSEGIQNRIRTLMANGEAEQAKKLLDGYGISSTLKEGSHQPNEGTVGTHDAYQDPSESSTFIDLMVAEKNGTKDMYTAYMYFKIDSDRYDIINEEGSKDPFAITFSPTYWQAKSQSRSNVEFSGSGEGAASQPVGSERFEYDDYTRYGVVCKLDEPEQETTADHYYNGCVSTDIQSIGDDADDKKHNVNAEYVHTWSPTDGATWLSVSLGPAGFDVSNIGGDSWRMETTEKA